MDLVSGSRRRSSSSEQLPKAGCCGRRAQIMAIVGVVAALLVVLPVGIVAARSRGGNGSGALEEGQGHGQGQGEAPSDAGYGGGGPDGGGGSDAGSKGAGAPSGREGAFKPVWAAANDNRLLNFRLEPHLSDEFSTRDIHKWSFAGDLNENGCAAWMGPAPLYLDPTGAYASVSHGRLSVKMKSVGEYFFKSREYYCVSNEKDSKHGFCNWDDAKEVPCLDKTAGRYDDWRCKKAPHCFPAGQTMYDRYVSAQVQSRRKMHYGFVEVRAKAPPTSSRTVAAAWLNDHFWDPPYSGVTPNGQWHAKNPLRRRFWYEIDFLELSMGNRMGSDYVPNVHLFADYDGRHTSKPGKPNGPIIQDESIAGKRANSLHWNPGPVYTHPDTFDKNWNVFGMWWDENEIRFLVNGKEVSRQKNRYMHAPQFLKFTLLSNPEWLGRLPEMGEHSFDVDYIRTWSVDKSDAFKRNPFVIPGTLKLDDRMGEAKPPPVQWPPKYALRTEEMGKSANTTQRLRGLSAHLEDLTTRADGVPPTYWGPTQFQTPSDPWNPVQTLSALGTGKYSSGTGAGAIPQVPGTGGYNFRAELQAH